MLHINQWQKLYSPFYIAFSVNFLKIKKKNNYDTANMFIKRLSRSCEQRQIWQLKIGVCMEVAF